MTNSEKGDTSFITRQRQLHLISLRRRQLDLSRNKNTYASFEGRENTCYGFGRKDITFRTLSIGTLQIHCVRFAKLRTEIRYSQSSTTRV